MQLIGQYLSLVKPQVVYPIGSINDNVLNASVRLQIAWTSTSCFNDQTYCNKLKLLAMKPQQPISSPHHSSLQSRQYGLDYAARTAPQTALRQVLNDSLRHQMQYQPPHEGYPQGSGEQGKLHQKSNQATEAFSYVDQSLRSPNAENLQAPFLPQVPAKQAFPATYIHHPNPNASYASNKDASGIQKLNRTIVNELIDPDHQEDVMDRIEVQNNIVENINETPNYEQEYVVPADELNDIRQKHGSDIFHCMAPDFRLEDIFEMRHYRLVRGGGAASVYSLDSSHRTLKLVMELPHSREKVLAALIDPANYHLWNDQVDFGSIKLRIYSENTVIAYQKHRAFDSHFRERDFLYIRHLFQKSGVIYVADKSIEHASFPPFDYITRGEIKYGIWAFEELSSRSTRVIYLLHMDFGDTLSSNKSAESMIKYLESMARLSHYLSRNGRIPTMIAAYFDISWGINTQAKTVSIPKHKQFGQEVSFDGKEELYLTAFPEAEWHEHTTDQSFPSQQQNERNYVAPVSQYTSNRRLLHNEVFNPAANAKQIPNPYERQTQRQYNSNHSKSVPFRPIQTHLSKEFHQKSVIANGQAPYRGAPHNTIEHSIRQAYPNNKNMASLAQAKQPIMIQTVSPKIAFNQQCAESTPRTFTVSVQNPRSSGVKLPPQSGMPTQHKKLMLLNQTGQVSNTTLIKEQHSFREDYQMSNPSQLHILKDGRIKLDTGGLVVLPQSYLKVRHKLSHVKSEYKILKKPSWKNYLLRDLWQPTATGELRCIDAKLLKEQRGAFSYILKRIPKDLLGGKNIMNISLPASIFSQQSYLQILAKGSGHAPLFLERAAVEDNPIERLKWVTAFMIGCCNTLIEMEKPFNPILGETYQGWINGCPVYGEQISHHPPISYVTMMGRGYRHFCKFEPKMHLGLNTTHLSNEGQFTIQFDRYPNNNIHYQVMDSQMFGVFYGQRLFLFDGKSYTYDGEGHFLELTFNPSKKGMFSFGKQSKPADWVEGSLVKTSPMFIAKFRKDKKRQGPSKKDISQTIAVASGRWSESIKFDGVEYYNIQRDQPFALEEEPYPLSSNCCYRQDIAYRRRKDIDRAQIEKERLEALQRNDKKLRDKHAKTR